jgi:hypothetical protein
MKHTKLFAFLVLLFTAGTPSPVVLEPLIINVASTSLAPTTRFVEYLKNVVEVLRISESSSADWAEKHVKNVETLLKKIDGIFARGAFKATPLVQTRFYAILCNVNVRKWPSPSLVRDWLQNFMEFKEYLFSVHFSPDVLNMLPRERELNHLVVDSVMVLCRELKDHVFTEDFFDFSTLELLADICVVQPLEFTRDHPFIVATGVLLLVGGYFGYQHYSEQARLTEWMKQEDIKFIRSKQSAAECGVWTLYRQWCHSQTKESPERYEELACDQVRFGRFRKFVQGILERQEQARVAALPAHAPAAARRVRRVTTNWLEIDDVRHVLDVCNEAATEGNAEEFAMEVAPEIVTRDAFDPQRLREIRYRHRRTGLVCMPQDLPLDRVADYVQEVVDLRDAPDKRAVIQEFRRQRGNVVDYIFNTNEAPVNRYEALAEAGRANIEAERLAAEARAELARVLALNDANLLAAARAADNAARARAAAAQAEVLRVQEPAAEGHFFHIRAINDPTAKEAVRFIVSDTFKPNINEVSQLLTNIRQFFRP